MTSDNDWRKPRGESPSRRKVRELSEAGVKPADIARRLSMTPQNVYMHLAKIREEAAS